MGWDGIEWDWIGWAGMGCFSIHKNTHEYLPFVYGPFVFGLAPVVLLCSPAKCSYFIGFFTHFEVHQVVQPNICAFMPFGRAPHNFVAMYI